LRLRFYGLAYIAIYFFASPANNLDDVYIMAKQPSHAMRACDGPQPYNPIHVDILDVTGSMNVLRSEVPFTIRVVSIRNLRGSKRGRKSSAMHAIITLPNRL